MYRNLFTHLHFCLRLVITLYVWSWNCSCALPVALVCVVRIEGTPYLCHTDEVGEICLSSSSTGISYFGLPGMTKNVFEVRFNMADLSG